MRIISLFLISFTAAIFAASAEDANSAAQEYREESAFYLLTCRMSPDKPGCIAKRKTEARAKLDAAMRATKNPKAREALKAYHAVLASALEGVMQGSGERDAGYAQRQKSLDDRLSEAWARFELE